MRKVNLCIQSQGNLFMTSKLFTIITGNRMHRQIRQERDDHLFDSIFGTPGNQTNAKKSTLSIHPVMKIDLVGRRYRQKFPQQKKYATIVAVLLSRSSTLG